MPERPESGAGAGADAGNRFDGECVRRILQRAVAEQHRLEDEAIDTYSLEDLEEMAAEAGISEEALRAAIESVPEAEPDERRRWLATMQRPMPVRWSPVAKGIVLAGAGGIALFGVVLAFPVVGQVLLWGTIALALLILLGGTPF